VVEPRPDLVRSGESSDAEFCAEAVRKHDYDRWLTALFVPVERRAAVLALFAFNLELARTREQVSEPMLGEIRLQWWRETIEGAYAGKPRQHPIAKELAVAVVRHRLSRAHFDRLIDARAQDLYETPPKDLAALEIYAEATSAELASLALEVLGVDDAPSIAAAHAAAVAWALVGIARAVPFHAAFRRVHLPQDALTAEGASTEDVIYGRKPEAIRRVIALVANQAARHLEAARGHRVARAALPALLPAALADIYLAQLRRAGFDPRHPRLQVSASRKHFRLLGKALLHLF